MSRDGAAALRCAALVLGAVLLAIHDCYQLAFFALLLIIL